LELTIRVPFPSKEEQPLINSIINGHHLSLSTILKFHQIFTIPAFSLSALSLSTLFISHQIPIFPKHKTNQQNP
jgi:hypothetical protein